MLCGARWVRIMDIFDFTHELRTGTPDVKKAEKGMNILGGICLLGGIWNYAIFYIAPFNEPPFNLPPWYPYVALTILSLLGLMFLYSARGIRQRVHRGGAPGSDIHRRFAYLDVQQFSAHP